MRLMSGVGPLTAVHSALFANLVLMGLFAFVCDEREIDLGLELCAIVLS